MLHKFILVFSFIIFKIVFKVKVVYELLFFAEVINLFVKIMKISIFALVM